MSKKIHLSDSISILKKIAANPELMFNINLRLNQKENEILIHIEKYNKNKKIVFLDEMFEK